MAVSDILITALAVPRQITEILLGPRRWLIDGVLGSLLCKSVYFFQDITIGVSILSLLAIAIDRYRGIVFPLRKQFRKPAKLCKVIVPTIWLTSMGLQAIYFYIFRLVTVDTKTYCIISWDPKLDPKKSQQAHFIVIFVCLIAMPSLGSGYFKALICFSRVYVVHCIVFELLFKFLDIRLVIFLS